MLRRCHINAVPRARALRSALAAADALRWPFEQLAWLFERRFLWPLRQRLAGWAPSGSAAGAAALAALAGAAVVVGVLWPSGNGAHEQVAAPAQVAIATPTPQSQAEKPHGPALQGATPSFGVGAGVGVAKQSNVGAGGADRETSPADRGASNEAASSGSTAAATTSSEKPVPAGPAAMKVARRFSEAFVFYEVGERPARAKAVFEETATATLASALSERPPRLPENAKVPKAEVVNLVPGPRHGGTYTVSVSLLRVGLTSELRLSLLPDASGNWKVMDVLG
jgi:hypothetical protein